MSLPKYGPPTPLSARRVCTPRLCCGGRTHSPGGEGGGGSIFWKTQDIGLASYCNNLSTLRMHYGRMERGLVKFLHSGDPDVICLVSS
jgi:hypothetical protein